MSENLEISSAAYFITARLPSTDHRQPSWCVVAVSVHWPITAAAAPTAPGAFLLQRKTAIAELVQKRQFLNA